MLIAVENALQAKEVHSAVNCELLAIDVLLRNKSDLRIITVYHSTTHDIAALNRITALLEELNKSVSRYIIIGDFNLPDFDWNNPSLNTIEPYSSFQLFVDKSQPIFQVIDFPTRKTKILDILLTNAPDLICKLKEEQGRSQDFVIGGAKRKFGGASLKNF